MHSMESSINKVQAQSASATSIDDHTKSSRLISTPEVHQRTLSPAPRGTIKHWTDRDDEVMAYTAEVNWDIDPDDKFPDSF